MRCQFLERLVVAARIKQMRYRRSGRQFRDRHHARFARRLGLALPRLGQLLRQLIAARLGLVGQMLRQVIVLVLHLPLGPERQLTLHGGPLLGKAIDGGEHILRELHPLVPGHLDPRFPLDRVQFVTEGRRLFEPFPLLTVVLGQLTV